MAHSIPYFRRIMAASLGFMVVLMLTAMSALGMTDECHHETSTVSVGETANAAIKH
ncbi:MAG: hypothetical protein GY791_06335 [Alphaproteobacteria bacterium]|nr:hypothetical protein [Alphaproteobacteria bacterium]